VTMGLSFYFFLHIFPYQRERLFSAKTLLVSSLYVFLTVALVCNVVAPNLIDSGCGLVVVTGPFYSLLMLFGIIVAGFGIFDLFKKYLRAESADKQKIKYVLWSASILAISIVLANVILSGFGITFPSYLSPLFSLPF